MTRREILTKSLSFFYYNRIDLSNIFYSLLFIPYKKNNKDYEKTINHRMFVLRMAI